MTFIFRNRTIFWDISKWNRGQKKWDGGSIWKYLWKYVWVKKCVKMRKMLFKNENCYLKTQIKHLYARIFTNIFKQQFSFFKYMYQTDHKCYIFKYIWCECSKKNNVLKKMEGRNAMYVNISLIYLLILSGVRV